MSLLNQQQFKTVSIHPQLVGQWNVVIMHVYQQTKSMFFLIRAILNCEISGETNVANHDAISDAGGCHGYRRSGDMQYTRPRQRTADWPGRRPTGQ